jgi:hypothetical protein
LAEAFLKGQLNFTPTVTGDTTAFNGKFYLPHAPLPVRPDDAPSGHRPAACRRGILLDYPIDLLSLLPTRAQIRLPARSILLVYDDLPRILF